MIQDPGFSSNKILDEYNRLNNIDWGRVNDNSDEVDYPEEINEEPEDGFYEGDFE